MISDLSPKPESVLYFAYGSNMDLKQMKERCPSARVISVGSLKNYRLDFTKDDAGWEGGVADIVTEKNNEVWGIVYEVTKKDLAKLDEYEDYPTSYTRFPVTIDVADGVIENVLVYSVVNKRGYVAPAKFYLQWLKDAADQYKFPESYKLMLETVPTE